MTATDESTTVAAPKAPRAAGASWRPNADLAHILLDLRLRISRTVADTACRPMDRASEFERDGRAAKVNAKSAGTVSTTTVLVRETAKTLAGLSPIVGPPDVASAMTAAGHPIDKRTIYRRPEYMAAIAEALGDTPPPVHQDPERARIARLSKQKLEKEIRSARRELATAEWALRASLADTPPPDRERLASAAAAARQAHAARRKPPEAG